jgi:secernin
MGCDMLVALGQATAERQSFFGQSCRQISGFPTIQRTLGRDFALGEKTHTQFLELDQARRTAAVVGSQPAGFWGYHHGLNEFHLAVGCCAFQTKLHCHGPGLVGPDLVRLALERCRSARQAVDLVASLVTRYGQGAFPDCPDLVEGDYGFLIADPKEAFALEASGHFWAHQEIRQVRAVGDLCLIRQEWDGIAHGVADLAADRGWWTADGSKLDFAGALEMTRPGSGSELRRWGRATRLLEEQNGHIDRDYLRRALSDHFEGDPDEVDPLEAGPGPVPLCCHSAMSEGGSTVASFIAELPADATELPVLWCAFGPPCTGVYLPVFVDGDTSPLTPNSDLALPLATSRRLLHLHSQAGSSRECLALFFQDLGALQAEVDRETAGFAKEVSMLKANGERTALRRRIGLFSEHIRERIERVVGRLEETTSRFAARLETVTPV